MVDRLVEFSANQVEVVVTIPLVDDVFPEEQEEFEVILEASPGVFIDSPASATVSILNDDPDLPGNKFLCLATFSSMFSSPPHVLLCSILFGVSMYIMIFV